MDNTNQTICLYSYNSRGSSDEKLDFIKDILEIPSVHTPIFCIQEHFLLRNNIYKLSKAFGNYSVLAKPAYKNFQVQDSGRPMGGLATIIPKYLRKHTTVLSNQSWRIQPLTINLQRKTYLIINTYFPTDPRRVGGENVELENTLAEISNLINSTEFDFLYLVGDLNSDMIRNSSHVEAVKEFMISLNLYSLWEDYTIDFTHSFQKEDGNCFVHTLDHILTLKRSKKRLLMLELYI